MPLYTSIRDVVLLLKLHYPDHLPANILLPPCPPGALDRSADRRGLPGRTATDHHVEADRDAVPGWTVTDRHGSPAVLSADQQAVVAFLVAMAKAALRSSRREVVLRPLPLTSDQTAPSRGKDLPSIDSVPYDRMCSALDVITARDIARVGRSDLRQQLSDKDDLAFPLLHWVLTSTRSRIVRLPPKRQLPFMGTTHQFLVAADPPSRQARFQAAKARSGSVFAYHGSRLENWHSILRHGLLVASETPLQVNGNHYGNGVYLSPYPRVAWLYSVGSSGNPAEEPPGEPPGSGGNLLEAGTLCCLALCEVAAGSGTLSRLCDTQWVCSSSDHVSVRLLFVYESAALLGGPLTSYPVEDFRRQVEVALGHYAG